MGAIYKIINIINNKVYIGKTKRQPVDRWKEHLREYKKENNIPLYNAFNKYGINNFIFQILEDNIQEKDLNDKERYYIKLYNSKSHEQGYNITDGGDGGKTSSLLTEKEINEIFALLSDTSNFESFNKIGKKYKLSGSAIRQINLGETYYNNNIDYPVRKYNSTGINISIELYRDIVKDLQDETIAIKDILKKYNLSNSKLESINYGRHCYNKQNLFYKDFCPDIFPIRKQQKISITEDTFQEILYNVLFLNKTINSLGKIYNMKSNTIQYILDGKRRKNLTKNFKTPISKYKEENKKIYLSIYGEKGGFAK